MTQLDEQYEHARSDLLNRGYDVADLEHFTSVLERISVDEHDSTFAEFHNRAGRFPFTNDSDFGALVLERRGGECASADLRARLYREATWRARWCAQASTSGGEGHARSLDLERLTAKTHQAEQDAGDQAPAAVE